MNYFSYLLQKLCLFFEEVDLRALKIFFCLYIRQNLYKTLYKIYLY